MAINIAPLKAEIIAEVFASSIAVKYADDESFKFINAVLQNVE